MSPTTTGDDGGGDARGGLQRAGVRQLREELGRTLLTRRGTGHDGDGGQAAVSDEERQDAVISKPKGSATVEITIRIATTRIQARVEVVVDTGADITMCTSAFLLGALGQQSLDYVSQRGVRLPRLVSASGERLKAMGYLRIELGLGQYSLMAKVIVQENRTHSIFLLGSDLMYGRCILDRGRYLAFAEGRYPPLPIRYRMGGSQCRLSQELFLGPGQAAVVPVELVEGGQLVGHEVVIGESKEGKGTVGGLVVENSLAEIDAEGRSKVLLENQSNESITLAAGFVVAEASLLEDDSGEGGESEPRWKRADPQLLDVEEWVKEAWTDEFKERQIPDLEWSSEEERREERVNFIHDRDERGAFLEGKTDGLPSPSAHEPLDDIETGSEHSWMKNIEHEHLTEARWQALKEVLVRNADAFVQHQADIGCCRFFKATLPLKPGTGFLYNKPRQLPMKHREIAEKAIQELLAQGVIRPSMSPHATNIVVVKKKALNGEVQHRVCVDLRMVNAHTVPNRYPNFQLEDATAKMTNSAWRTGLDFCNAFHQIVLEESSIPVTGFSCNGKLYEYVRLPFGHQNAMNLFCNVMALLCQNVQEAIYYADDLIVVTPKEEVPDDQLFGKHLGHIDAMLKRIIHAGMKLKAHKCQWAYPASMPMKYVGLVLMDGLIKPQEDKMEAVQKFPTPTSVKQAQAFAGLCSWNRKFVPMMAKRMKPIYDTIVEANHTGTYRWTEEAEAAFIDLKQALCSPPALRLPVQGQPFIVYTDASHGALGAVLCQRDPPESGPIHNCAYASRLFNESERKLSTPCKELIAICWALEKFAFYLCGNPVQVYSDCRAWTFLKVQQGASGKIARLSLIVQDHDISVAYIPGHKNKAADGLSRAFDDGKMALDDQIAPRHPALEKIEAVRLPEGEVVKWAEYDKLCEPEAKRMVKLLQEDKAGRRELEAEAQSVTQTIASCRILHFDRCRASQHYTLSEGWEGETEDEAEVTKWRLREENQSSTLSLETSTTDGSVKKITYNARMVALGDPYFSLEAFAAAQLADPAWVSLRDKVQAGDKATRDKGYAIKRGVLIRRFETKDGEEYEAVCVPAKLVKLLLRSTHGTLMAGHQGSQKYLMDMSKRYYWKGMRQDILEHQKGCIACQLNDKYPVRFKMGEVLTPLYPMHVVYYDIVVGLPRSKEGYYTMLLFYDGFSKFVLGVPLASEKAEYIVRKVVEHFLGPMGFPWALHSDNGRNLDGHLVRYLALMLGITKTTTPPYTPNSNPCETMCGAVTRLIIKALGRKDRRFWPQYVPFVLNALNSTVHSATGYTPRSLFFGRPIERSPVPLIPCQPEDATVSEYIRHTRKAQELQWQLVRARSAKLMAKRRTKANETAREHKHQIGDYVLVKNLAPAAKGELKLRAKYVGPYRVVHVYPSSLIVIPWGEVEDFRKRTFPHKWFGAANRRGVRPYSPRVVSVRHCKPYRENKDPDLYDHDLLREFLEEIDELADSHPSMRAQADTRQDMEEWLSRRGAESILDGGVRSPDDSSTDSDSWDDDWDPAPPPQGAGDGQPGAPDQAGQQQQDGQQPDGAQGPAGHQGPAGPQVGGAPAPVGGAAPIQGAVGPDGAAPAPGADGNGDGVPGVAGPDGPAQEEAGEEIPADVMEPDLAGEARAAPAVPGPLDDIDMDPEARGLLDQVILNPDQYAQADPQAQLRHDEVADILADLRHPDPEIRGQAEADAGRLVQDLKGEELGAPGYWPEPPEKGPGDYDPRRPFWQEEDPEARLSHSGRKIKPRARYDDVDEEARQREMRDLARAKRNSLGDPKPEERPKAAPVRAPTSATSLRSGRGSVSAPRGGTGTVPPVRPTGTSGASSLRGQATGRGTLPTSRVSTRSGATTRGPATTAPLPPASTTGARPKTTSRSSLGSEKSEAGKDA